MEDVINYLRKVRRGTMFIIEGPSGTGKGTVIKGKTAYGCSEWKNGCTFRKPFE